MKLESYIRDVPNYPKEGIIFKDLTTLWKDADAFKYSIDQIVEEFKDKGITKVVGPESRGFLMGAPVAYLLNVGFVPIRKKGKLPSQTISKSYQLEYGEAVIEIHKDALDKNDKVLIVDDLLATGGTATAMIDLIKSLGAQVLASAFLVELDFLNGRKALDCPVFSLVHY